MQLNDLWAVTIAATVVFIIVTRFPWVRRSIRAGWSSLTRNDAENNEYSTMDVLFGYVYLFVFVSAGIKFALIYLYLILVTLGVWEIPDV